MSEALSDVLREEARWDQVVSRVLSPDAELLSVSRWLADSRAYASSERVAVIRMTDGLGSRTLANASEVRKRLSLPTQYSVGDGWEALVMPRIEGVTLESVIPRTTRRERLTLLIGAIREIRSLHRRGVAHCDLRPDNILVTPNGDIHLVDFDRAQPMRPLLAALADWVGVGASGPAPKPVWKLVLLTMEPRSRSLLLHLRARLPRRTRSMPDDPQLQMLDRAWSLAESSDANAPGQGLAYYSFTFKGWHFPGERAWYERWEPIRRRVDFANKRVLELGCNMGLLSSFAALHGASEAIGVDRSESIVEAARILSDALDAPAEFRCFDLAWDADWEEQLAGADVVTAMSVVHWLPNPERVLRFISQHAELIYEGHDPPAVEAALLRRLGFSQIEVICSTGRGRDVFYARR